MRFKLGRKKPVARQPMLRLNNYLLRNFPNPPPTADYSTKARGALADAYGNNIAGNCTIVAPYHIAAVILANSNQLIPFVAQDALTLYQKLSGWNGIPDDPSDVGLDEHQVLNYWAMTGLSPGAHKITGFVQINPADAGEIQAAIWLFENIYRAAGLPQPWIDGMDNMTDGFTWDVAGPQSDQGHAWMACGYDANGTKVDSWGMLGRETYASTAANGATYAALSADSIDKASQKAPAGFNFTQLLSDLESLGPIQT